MLFRSTEYNVRVRAVFEAGEGEWSEVHTETTFDSEFTCLHVRLCHLVTFCDITVVSVPVKNVPHHCTHCIAPAFTVASNVVFSVSLPI